MFIKSRHASILHFSRAIHGKPIERGTADDDDDGCMCVCVCLAGCCGFCRSSIKTNCLPACEFERGGNNTQSWALGLALNEPMRA